MACAGLQPRSLFSQRNGINTQTSLSSGSWGSHQAAAFLVHGRSFCQSGHSNDAHVSDLQNVGKVANEADYNKLPPCTQNPLIVTSVATAVPDHLKVETSKPSTPALWEGWG